MKHGTQRVLKGRASPQVRVPGHWRGFRGRDSLSRGHNVISILIQKYRQIILCNRGVISSFLNRNDGRTASSAHVVEREQLMFVRMRGQGRRQVPFSTSPIAYRNCLRPLYGQGGPLKEAFHSANIKDVTRRKSGSWEVDVIQYIIYAESED